MLVTFTAWNVSPALVSLYCGHWPSFVTNEQISEEFLVVWLFILFCQRRYFFSYGFGAKALVQNHSLSILPFVLNYKFQQSVRYKRGHNRPVN